VADTGTGCSATSAATTVMVKPATDAGYHYRTVASGNWNTTTVWESSTDNINFSLSCIAPGLNAASILIQSPHVVTVTANTSAAKTTINNGGKLTVNTGVILTTK
jgi:hypothetical protein